jgi:hypothetical protein
MRSSDATKNLELAGVVTPVAESQVRSLAALPADEQAEAWTEAQARAGSKQPPARVVAEVVRDRSASPTGDTPADEDFDWSSGEFVEPEAAPAEVAPAAADPEDEQSYLEGLLARAGLSERCRAWFDAEALLFRRVSAARSAYRDATHDALMAAKRVARHTGPWTERHERYMRLNDPSRWDACSVCTGSGLHGGRDAKGKAECSACRGHGYLV